MGAGGQGPAGKCGVGMRAAAVAVHRCGPLARSVVRCTGFAAWVGWRGAARRRAGRAGGAGAGPGADLPGAATGVQRGGRLAAGGGGGCRGACARRPAFAANAALAAHRHVFGARCGATAARAAGRGGGLSVTGICHCVASWSPGAGAGALGAVGRGGQGAGTGRNRRAHGPEFAGCAVLWRRRHRRAGLTSVL